MVSRNHCATTAASMFVDHHGVCPFFSSTHRVVVRADVFHAGSGRAAGGSKENLDDLLGKFQGSKAQVIPLWGSREAEITRRQNATTKKWKARKKVSRLMKCEGVVDGNRHDVDKAQH